MLIIEAVLNRMCPGDIYADDLNPPESAFIVSPEGYCLGGYHKNSAFNQELHTILTEKIIPQKIKEGEQNLSLNYYPELWEPVIPELLHGLYPVPVHGYTFNLNQLKITDWKDRIPAGFSIVKIDEPFLELPLKNMEKIKEWVTGPWISTDIFLEHGFGFCLVHDESKTIASWSLADCVIGPRCEIGIETAEEFRRKGFATITATAAAEYALSEGLTDIGWHTSMGNIGSIKTAEKVGFTKVLTDMYYFCWFYPVDNLIEHGYFSGLERNYTESAQWYEQALVILESGEYKSFQVPQNHTIQDVYYYAACLWALAGERDKSINNLKKIMKRGVEDPQKLFEQVTNSGSLEVLHNMPEWDKLIENLKNMKK
jgi:RimJ/RimL family protein N-acetyltransferase